MRFRFSSVAFIASLLSVSLLAVCLAATGKLVIVGYGGTYQKAQDQAFYSPFAKETGITVTQGVGPQIERSMAEVQSGHPQYDLTATNQAFYLIGVEHNLWEPIDYKYFRKEDLAAMAPETHTKFGVGTIYYAEGMFISTKAYPSDKPQPNSWADFWNVAKFPGKRALPRCDVATYPLPEAALLADGVPPNKLYPIDIPRALKKLKELAPNATFYSDLAQPGSLVLNGDATMGIWANGRVQSLIDKGAPLKFVWNGARRTFDMWYVLRGTPDKDEAMRFIAFASRPEQQAEMARLTGYAPTNANAMKLLDQATREKLVTYPPNLRQTVQKSEDWWKANRQKWVEACTEALQ